MSKKQFKLTETHIKLLKNANVSWSDCEFGAPGIDCKRPYGNGDVHRDIANILGFPPSDNEDEPYPEPMLDYFDKLHQSLETALQIVLKVGEFKQGIYEADDYHYNWRLRSSDE